MVRLLTDDYPEAFDLSPDHRVLAFVRRDQPDIFLRNFPDGRGRD